MEQSGAGAIPKKPTEQFVKNVILLKNCDFQEREIMPTPSEISIIRARAGQYKKGVEFHASMSADMVKIKLEETFPYLKNKRYFCAAKVNPYNDSSEFDFLGPPRLWDGRTIKRRIQGNSILYILEDDQMDTGGISGRDPESSQDDLQQKGSEIGNISKTLSQMTLREETKDEDQESTIIRATMEFEAKHEECLLVYPYKNNGKVVVHLYVYMYRSAIPPALKTAAKEFFGPMEVRLEWFDLYNEAYNVLNVTSIEYPSGEPNRLKASQVDEIDEIINKNLDVFSKHRNITAVQPSFKVTKSVQTEEVCITVYVLGKGNIPLGESAIPCTVGGFPVDIVNGFCIRTNNPKKPTEAHEQKDFVCLGASIGVKEKQSSGTLGAVVEDANSGTLYVLSCDHVMKHADTSEIIHPGLDVYLNCLHYHLNEYKTLIDRLQPNCELPQLSGDILQEPEKLLRKFNDLKKIVEAIKEHCNSPGRSELLLKLIREKEEAIEEVFSKPPRIIANYSAGIRYNVSSTRNSGKEHFIDAAISELNKKEEENLKHVKSITIIMGSGHSPSGECIPATTVATVSVEELCKSGSGSGFTQSKRLVGCPPISTITINGFRQQGANPWIDRQCIICEEREAAQSQVQELCSPCEVCKPDRWLKSCLCIQNHAPELFSDHGDSGAVIFERRRKTNEKGAEAGYETYFPGFGIIFAVHKTSYYDYTLASPLEVALEALSQEVSKPDSMPCELRLTSELRWL